MIRQKIKIEKYDWKIYAYYAISTYYIDEILEHLWEIGVDGENAKRAYENLSENKLDTGLCYSNFAKRKSQYKDLWIKKLKLYIKKILCS